MGDDSNQVYAKEHECLTTTASGGNCSTLGSSQGGWSKHPSGQRWWTPSGLAISKFTLGPSIDRVLKFVLAEHRDYRFSETGKVKFKQLKEWCEQHPHITSGGCLCELTQPRLLIPNRWYCRAIDECQNPRLYCVNDEISFSRKFSNPYFWSQDAFAFGFADGPWPRSSKGVEPRFGYLRKLVLLWDSEIEGAFLEACREFGLNARARPDLDFFAPGAKAVEICRTAY